MLCIALLCIAMLCLACLNTLLLTTKHARGTFLTTKNARGHFLTMKSAQNIFLTTNTGFWALRPGTRPWRNKEPGGGEGSPRNPGPPKPGLSQRLLWDTVRIPLGRAYLGKKLIPGPHRCTIIYNSSKREIGHTFTHTHTLLVDDHSAHIKELRTEPSGLLAFAWDLSLGSACLGSVI